MHLSVGTTCVEPAGTYEVTLSQEDLLQPVEAYYTLLRYDPNDLTFLTATYTSSPYDHPLTSVAGRAMGGGRWLLVH